MASTTSDTKLMNPRADLKQNDSALIEHILQDWLEFGYQNSGMTVFDRDKGHFMLLEVAWHERERIYRVIAHIDIVDGKFWIQVDHTPTGIGVDLEEAGIPKERIVLGFYPLEHRQYGEYAVE
jgi:XisI protein